MIDIQVGGGPVRILFVVGTLSGLGGIETCLRTMWREARAAGDEAKILALCPSTRDGRWHEELSYAEVANASTSLAIQSITGLPAIVRELRGFRPDVVVVIYSSSVPLARLAALLSWHRCPVVSWLHFSTALKQRLGLLRFAHAHICISSEIKKSLSKVKGISIDVAHVVHNGVSLMDAVQVARSSSGPVRLLHIGRLMCGGQKRTDDLLRSLALVRGEWQLDVIGGGEDLDHLRSLAIELSISERIVWHGHLSDPWAIVGAADALVLCSAFEGFPMVLIEALARGVPCFSSDCPSGPSEILLHGKNGWLFPTGNLDALAVALQRMVCDRTLLPPASTVRASAQRFGSLEAYRKFRAVLQATIRRASPNNHLPKRSAVLDV